jgi:hypothetical protein
MFDYRILKDPKLVVNATCVRLFCTWQNVFHSMHSAVDATATPSIFTASLIDLVNIRHHSSEDTIPYQEAHSRVEVIVAQRFFPIDCIIL